MSEVNADVVVIGAGVIGAAIAYRLAATGAGVVLVDKGEPGFGTTASSFAWLNAFHKPPRHYHLLNAESVREHQKLVADVGGDWVHMDGGLAWADESDPEQLSGLRANVAQLREWGYQVDSATPGEVVRGLEPDLAIDADKVPEVYVFSGEGWIEAPRMVHWLLIGAQLDFGARVVHGAVTEIRTGTGGVDVVIDGEVIASCDTVVNAAGPDAAEVAALAGTDLPLRREPGLLVATGAAPTRIRHVIRAGGFSLRPDGGGRLLLHRRSADYRVKESDSEVASHPVARVVMEEAVRLIPALRDTAPEAVRIGVRPWPADGLPLIGRDPGVPSLYHAVMHSGVTLSALVSKLVASDLRGAPTPELEPYGIGRLTGTRASLAVD